MGSQGGDTCTEFPLQHTHSLTEYLQNWEGRQEASDYHFNSESRQHLSLSPDNFPSNFNFIFTLIGSCELSLRKFGLNGGSFCAGSRGLIPPIPVPYKLLAADQVFENFLYIFKADSPPPPRSRSPPAPSWVRPWVSRG